MFVLSLDANHRVAGFPENLANLLRDCVEDTLRAAGSGPGQGSCANDARSCKAAHS